MSQISKALMEGLSLFLTSEIQARALDGITYTMLFDDPKDQDAYNEYMKIKEEARKCGYKEDEVFRVYKVSNGYIFDMDLSVAKHVTAKLSEVVSKGNGGQTPIGDLIGSQPENRRKEDMTKLAKLIQTEVKAGKKRIEVCLFSRNSVPRIVLNADTKNGGPVVVKYDAFAIRHWDIEDINTKILVPSGMKITKIEPCEIVPPKTGVRFVLHLSKI